MKRLLAFLLLFGAGLALLARIQGDDPLGRGQGERADGPEDSDFTGRAALQLRGPFSLLRYADAESGPRPTRLSLEAEDTESREGGEILFHRLTVVWNDEETNAPRATLRARLGSMQLTESGQRYPIDFEEDVAEDRLILSGVEVVLHQGGPVSPLTLEVDHLEGDLSERVFRSSAPATAHGPGLTAVGEGLLLDLLHDVVRFDANSEVVFTDQEAGTARLTCAGKLHVLKGSDGGAEVVARDTAALTLSGQEDVEIVGDRINIIATGTVGPDGERGTRLSRLSSQGDAVITLDLGSFRAARADLQVSPIGNMRARLTGEPTAKLQLKDPERVEVVELDVAGEGPLTITVARDRSFELAGPAEVRWEQNLLDAEGGLRGFAEGDGVSISGWGGVQLTSPNSELATPALDMRLAKRSADSIVQVTANGDSTLAGTGRGGEPFELSAEQVVYEQEGERWVLPLALGVNLKAEVADADGVVETLSVVADRVEGLDVTNERFLAEGDVTVLRGQQRAEGDRFEGLGIEKFVLEAQEPRVAVLIDADLHLEGRRIERDGVEVSSSGQALAKVAREDGSAEVRAGSLVGRVEARELPNGETETTYDLRTEGGVSVRFESGERKGQAQAGILHANLVERTDAEGNVLASRSKLTFDGELEGQVEENGERGELISRSARFEQPELDASWRGEARGDVSFSRKGTDQGTYEGHGDALVIDENGLADLSGLDGKKVRFDGWLPGGRYPFVLEAPAAKISPELVQAEDARIWIRSLSLLPGSDSMVVDSEVVAEADRLSAQAEQLSLSGSVSITGSDDDGVEMALDAEFVQFEASEQTKSGFRNVTVWGGFDFRYGDSFAAQGDRMDARAATGRLHITGSPAQVEYGEWVQVADSLDYDLFLRIIVEASAGFIRPSRATTPPAR